MDIAPLPGCWVLGARQGSRTLLHWKTAWGVLFRVAMTFLSGGLAGYFVSDSDLVKVADLKGGFRPKLSISIST